MSSIDAKELTAKTLDKQSDWLFVRCHMDQWRHKFNRQFWPMATQSNSGQRFGLLLSLRTPAAGSPHNSR